ncbi:MAG: hypothetical protein HZA50_07455 [Planctomycetes bacterium]|nr:hypothetical protein [Planctomycetota bacterium]
MGMLIGQVCPVYDPLVVEYPVSQDTYFIPSFFLEMKVPLLSWAGRETMFKQTGAQTRPGVEFIEKTGPKTEAKFGNNSTRGSGFADFINFVLGFWTSCLPRLVKLAISYQLGVLKYPVKARCAAFLKATSAI